MNDIVKVDENVSTICKCDQSQSLIRFKKELEVLIHRYSLENGCDTPDFIIANYLGSCLEAFNVAVKHRVHWYDVGEVIEKDNHL